MVTVGNKETNVSELDLSSVRIYTNTKDDILDAMDLIDEEVYLSNFSDFNTYDMCNLAGVIGIKYIESDSCHFLAEGDKGLGLHKYRFLILAKDAKFKEEEKEKVLRPFKDVEKLTKVKNAIAALLESLSHYTGRYGVKAYWDSYEGYEEFINSVVEACNIIEKDLAKCKERNPAKLRPFKSSWEFTQETGCIIGDVITIRSVDGKFEESCVVNGFKLLDTGPSTPHRVCISLGSNEYSLEKLMCCFDYMKDGEWKPFGVEE